MHRNPTKPWHSYPQSIINNPATTVATNDATKAKPNLDPKNTCCCAHLPGRNLLVLQATNCCSYEQRDLSTNRQMLERAQKQWTWWIGTLASRDDFRRWVCFPPKRHRESWQTQISDWRDDQSPGKTCEIVPGRPQIRSYSACPDMTDACLRSAASVLPATEPVVSTSILRSPTDRWGRSSPSSWADLTVGLFWCYRSRLFSRHSKEAEREGLFHESMINALETKWKGSQVDENYSSGWKLIDWMNILVIRRWNSGWDIAYSFVKIE